MRRRPAALARTYGVLQKNLMELESRLQELSVANPDALSYKHRTICREMAGKMDFAKALLAAEMESHTNNNNVPPLHIMHLGERLKAVEQALREWDLINSTGGSGVSPQQEALPDVSVCSAVVDEVLDLSASPEDGLRRDLSICSCTHECFEDEDEAEREEEEEEEANVPEPEPEDFGEEEEEDGQVPEPEPEDLGPVMERDAICDDGEMEQDRLLQTTGWRCRFISAAVAIAAAAIVVATNLYSVEEQLSLVPT